MLKNPRIARCGLAVLMLLGIAVVQAADKLDANGNYKDVDLAQLVEKSRTGVPGQRVIFAPAPVRFRAVLSDLPKAQKADYLTAAMGMMKVSSPPKVSHRIGLDYGGEKALAAYIEDETAKRLAESVKPGQTRTFYAFHVYNNQNGPALLVVSFQE